MRELPLLAIESAQYLDSLPWMFCPSPALVFHGPEKTKIAVVAFGQLPALKEEGLRKCCSLVVGNGLNW